MSLPLRREMKLRAAVEPVIGHVKAAHRKLTVARQYRTQRDCAIASIGRRRSASSGAGWRISALIRPVLTPLGAEST